MPSEAELTPSWEKARWRFSPAPQVLQRGLRESGPPPGETAGAPGKAPSGQPAAQGAGDGGRRGQQPRPPPARQCPPPRPARPRARQPPCRGGRLVRNPLARAGGSAGGETTRVRREAKALLPGSGSRARPSPPAGRPSVLKCGDTVA